jgi:hypothetical protein
MRNTVVMLSGFFLCAACGSSEEAEPDVMGFLGLKADAVFSYQVAVGSINQAGEMRIVGTDPAYREGVEAYKMEIRQNSNLIATRWLEVNAQGLFLLGEAASEQSQWVERKFETPIKLIPYVADGKLPINWSTESAVVQGGRETHRFDNQGQESLTVPAGDFQAFHLVHQRTREGQGSLSLDEFFAPGKWYPRFEYPADQVWSLNP